MSQKTRHARNNSVGHVFTRMQSWTLCTYFFFGFWFLYSEYAIVLRMTSSYVTELRNVDWELFLLYSEGLVKPEREVFLWAEVDRLEALIELES